MDRHIESNRMTLHVVEHGSGPTTLVLAPGLTANAHCFDGLISHGLADGLRVLCLDLRGRGESSKPDSGYEMADHAADVLGMLDELGLDTVMMGGHSFGGLLTYWMGAHHPDRVERCVVLDAPAEVDAAIVDQIQPSLDRLGRTFPSFEAYLEAIRGQPYFDGWSWDPAIEGYYRADVELQPDGSVRARSDPAHIARAVDGTTHVDWPAMVQRIRQPTLLVRATRPFGPAGSPPILEEDQARRTVERLPAGRLVEIDANHLTMLFGDGAGPTVAAIRSFVI